jgi:hypothetical protein
MIGRSILPVNCYKDSISNSSQKKMSIGVDSLTQTSYCWYSVINQRAINSAVRVLALQARGHKFESCIAHYPDSLFCYAEGAVFAGKRQIGSCWKVSNLYSSLPFGYNVKLAVLPPIWHES